MGSQQYCLRWNNHQSSVMSVFSKLLTNESLVDVTLACEGAKLKAHRVVLSACSPYFQEIFEDNPCQHPVVILKDFTFSELRSLVDFIYKGEVNINQQCLDSFLKTAESLQISGLANVSTDQEQQQPGGAVENQPRLPPMPRIIRGRPASASAAASTSAAPNNNNQSSSRDANLLTSVTSLCEVTVEETVRTNFSSDVIRLQDALQSASSGADASGNVVTRITSDLDTVVAASGSSSASSSSASHSRLIAKPRVSAAARASISGVGGAISRVSSGGGSMVVTPVAVTEAVSGSSEMVQDMMTASALVKEEVEIVDEELDFGEDLDSNYSRNDDNPDSIHSEMDPMSCHGSSSMDVSHTNMASTSAWPDGSVPGPSWALPLAPSDHDMQQAGEASGSGTASRKDSLASRMSYLQRSMAAGGFRHQMAPFRRSRRRRGDHQQTFPCTYCPQTFTNANNQRRHIRHFHQLGGRARIHACHLCPSAFNRKDNLAVHFRHNHLLPSNKETPLTADATEENFPPPADPVLFEG